MPPVTALTLDPGKTTGYCISALDEDVAYVAYDQAEWNVSDLDTMLYTLWPQHIICESFEFRNRARAGLDLTPVRLIGIVELFAEKDKERENRVKFQTAAQGKGYFTDSKIKSLGLYKPGFQHGRDALRHFLHWLHFGPGFQFLAKEQQFELVTEEAIIQSYFNTSAL
jgi:hypothetical protein